MNLVTAFMLIFVVAGAGVGIFAAAASQPSTPFVDTFGNTTDHQSNQTQAAVYANAPPVLSGLVMGIIIILSAFGIFVAAMLFWKPGSQQVLKGRR